MQPVYQFISLLGYGREPRKGAKSWECVSGITREAGRIGGACNHVRGKRDPVHLFGMSPVEAGELAIAQAQKARDHGDRFRALRREGHALFAGVASYPIPREVVEADPEMLAAYTSWREKTVRWLVDQFGPQLKSVVEHVDEAQFHIHFYVVPDLRADLRLNVPEIHPGYRMKYDAKEAGARKASQDAAYRSGMSRWQDDYWWDVSRHFGHARFGPKRTRLNRREHLHRKKMETERNQHLAEIEAARKQAERDAANRRILEDQQYARRLAALDQREAAFSADFGRVKAVVNEERAKSRRLEEELELLRARLLELEPVLQCASM
jgi:hypothetical protein